MGCLSSTSQRLLILRMPSASLYLTLNMVTKMHHSKRSRYQYGCRFTLARPYVQKLIQLPRAWRMAMESGGHMG